MTATGIRRLHVLPRPQSLEEAAGFLASALLISHGIRRDTAALVCLRKTAILARGDTVRHLRPDMESALGWVRAVAWKGKAQSLGAAIGECHELITEASRGMQTLTVYYNASRPLLPRAPREPRSGRPLSIVYQEMPGQPPGDSILLPGPAPLAAAIVNIVIDRWEKGLPAW